MLDEKIHPLGLTENLPLAKVGSRDFFPDLKYFPTNHQPFLS
jgi:hypothetical protein